MSGFSDWVLSDHAREEMARRGIPLYLLESVLRAPQAVIKARPGRVVAQGRFEHGSPPEVYLLRIFVDTDQTPPVVVTAYRTSNLTKYEDMP